MLKLLKRLWKGQPKCTHWWRENGVPGGFDIKVTIKNRHGKVNKQVASIYLGAGMPLTVQTDLLLKLCKGLDN